MIFVQIASYRDPQLLPTIVDCIQKAKYKNNIVIGALDQSLDSDPPLPWIPQNCRYHRVDASKSLGVCWARSIANNLLYQHEEFYLQIDSHSRFVDGWDQILLSQLEHSDKQYPILTGYPSSYWIENGNDVYGDLHATVTVPTKFDDNQMLSLGSQIHRLTKMRNAISLSGGFIFTTGSYVVTVPYDPNIYFLGEEIVSSIQAFTHGFDMLHPVNLPIYHYYIRPEAHRPWADKADWHVLNEKSMRYVKDILQGNQKNYFGTYRTLQQYEKYSGISFINHTITDESACGLIEPTL